MLTRKPYTKKDLEWFVWTPQYITKKSRDIINDIQKSHDIIKSIPHNERTFSNTLIGTTGERTMSDFLCIEFLAETSPDSAVRASAKEAVEYMKEQFITLDYDPEMYRAVREYDALYKKQKNKKEQLRPTDKKLLADTLRDYKQMGFDLPAPTQKEIQKLKKNISKLESAFNNNLNNYYDEVLLAKDELIGLPASYIRALKKKKGKYIITLDYPVIEPALQYAKSPAVRKKLADMLAQKGGKKNLVLMQKIVTLRHKTARILGYDNHASMRIEKEMAKTPARVLAFLKELETRIQAKNKAELKELSALKKADGFTDPLAYYDMKYYKEKATLQKYTLDQEILREYFPLDHVMKTAFETFGEVFGITFTPAQNLFPKKSLYTDVLIYAVHNKKDNALMGYCGFDLFPRKGKYGHMACFGVITGREYVWQNAEAGYQAPLAMLVGNFTPAGKDRPALLTHNEIQTFFHECGHIVHSILTEAPLETQSGCNVAYDFVELPSQMFENWTWDPKLLKKMSRHYITQKPLDDALITNLCRSRTHMEGLFGLSSLVYNSLFDMAIHMSDKRYDMPQLIQKLKYQVTGIKHVHKSLFPAGFGHMTGGYDARYYSYAWSLVYAYDCFSRFHKEGSMSKSAGRAFREEILSVGSSRPEMESLKKFLGRNPNQRAFISFLDN